MVYRYQLKKNTQLHFWLLVRQKKNSNHVCFGDCLEPGVMQVEPRLEPKIHGAKPSVRFLVKVSTGP